MSPNLVLTLTLTILCASAQAGPRGGYQAPAATEARTPRQESRPSPVGQVPRQENRVTPVVQAPRETPHAEIPPYLARNNPPVVSTPPPIPYRNPQPLQRPRQDNGGTKYGGGSYQPPQKTLPAPIENKPISRPPADVGGNFPNRGQQPGRLGPVQPPRPPVEAKQPPVQRPPEANRPAEPIQRPVERPTNPGRQPKPIEIRRQSVEHDRIVNRTIIENHRTTIVNVRNRWETEVNIHIDRPLNVHSEDRWRDRYNVWFTQVVEPTPIHFIVPIVWEEPMPDVETWNYTNLEIVAGNLEQLTQSIYVTMNSVTPYTAYGQRLRLALTNLVSASTNYTDSVMQTNDWSDSLDDLFYLDSQLSLVEQTLNGFSQDYQVNAQIQTMRYYINELLYTYRIND